MATKKTYADLSAELEEIMMRLQDSATDIDEALSLHERGQKLIKDMQAYLTQAQNKVKVIAKSPKPKAK